MTSSYDKFKRECDEEISQQRADDHMRSLSRTWMMMANTHKYSYHFEWLGRPIIQYPQDIVAIQEVIWRVKPQVILETGIAHGGSLIFSASMLELIAASGGEQGEVIGVDIEIRPHNRAAIETHPFARRIHMIEGSSTDPNVIKRIYERIGEARRALVILDSSHTHDHVLSELRSYAPLVRKGGYLIVLDTLIEDMPDEFSAGRPWGKQDNPGTAVRAFLSESSRFEIDQQVFAKLLISVAPIGYLRCVKDP